ncbi:outer membrane beta-barrel protein [Sulfurimonas sp.]|uniref:outer membrane beta-barrel protein n=1 Tax=Sulfurimonas sp. TaxID=2022749 RepID=UPI003563682E
MRIFLVLVFLFSLVYADRDGGPYLGIGYGVAEYDDDGLYEQITDKSAPYMFYYGGAYINKHLSVELGYAKIKDEQFKVVDSGVKKDVSYNLYNISALAHYAFFDDIWDFYAKFGAGYVTKNSKNGSSLLYGVGTSIRFNELISVKVAYDMYEFGYDENGNTSADYKMRIYYPYVALEFQF